MENVITAANRLIAKADLADATTADKANGAYAKKIIAARSEWQADATQVLLYTTLLHALNGDPLFDNELPAQADRKECQVYWGRG
ncbi:MAG: hypothetical protein HQL62_02345 [Magnetococcales bacterium]|nr:hypothetical protein [Magnetococcales bacterium]